MIKTNFIGKPPSWDPRIHLTKEVSSSWISTSPLITPLSPQKWLLLQEYTIRILTLMVVSALIYWKTSGAPLFRFEQYFSPFRRLCLLQTLTILLIPQLLNSGSRTNLRPCDGLGSSQRALLWRKVTTTSALFWWDIMANLLAVAWYFVKVSWSGGTFVFFIWYGEKDNWIVRLLKCGNGWITYGFLFILSLGM